MIVGASSATSDELQEEEVWAQQSVEAEEEDQVKRVHGLGGACSGIEGAYGGVNDRMKITYSWAGCFAGRRVGLGRYQ